MLSGGAFCNFTWSQATVSAPPPSSLGFLCRVTMVNFSSSLALYPKALETWTWKLIHCSVCGSTQLIGKLSVLRDSLPNACLGIYDNEGQCFLYWLRSPSQTTLLARSHLREGSFTLSHGCPVRSIIGKAWWQKWLSAMALLLPQIWIEWAAENRTKYSKVLVVVAWREVPMERLMKACTQKEVA